MRTATFRPRLEAMDHRIVPAVLIVDDDRRQRPSAQFTTIQAAVDAAALTPGSDTILVYPGTYAEQVTVSGTALNGLRLRAAGDGDAVIRPPTAGLTGFGILLTVTGGAKGVTVEGFTVRGPGSATGSLYAGIGVGSGASATIRDNRVLDIRGPLDKTGQLTGDQSGLGIVVQGADAVVEDNTVRGYQKAGVVVFGPAKVTIRDNTVTGAGKTGAVAQVGIQLGDGATGLVAGNTVTGNAYTGPVANGEAAGVVLFQAGPVVVRDNELSGNQIGIAAQKTTGGTLIVGNEVSRSTSDGIRVDGSKNVAVIGNEVERSGRYGIAVVGGSTNTLVALNRVSDSVTFDLFDGTPAGSNNVFVANRFRTRN